MLCSVGMNVLLLLLLLLLYCRRLVQGKTCWGPADCLLLQLLLLLLQQCLYLSGD